MNNFITNHISQQKKAQCKYNYCVLISCKNKFVERILQNPGSFHFIIKMVSIKTKISKINMEIKHFRTTKYLKTTTVLKSEKRGAASYNCLVNFPSKSGSG